MKLSPTISLQELSDLLYEGLSKRFPDVEGFDVVIIESYEQPRITIDYRDGPMVEAVAFRHRAK